MPRSRLRVAVAVCAVFVAAPTVAQQPARMPPVPGAVPRPVAVRVQWGGGQPRAWSGTITIVDASGAADREPEWRTLCTEPDAAAMVHAEAGRLIVHQPRPIAADGIEIVVPHDGGWRIQAAVGPAGAAAAARLDVAVADLFAHEAVQPLDGDGNRLAVRLAPGEPLRATIETAAGRGTAVVCRPAERVRVTVDPLLVSRADGTGVVELRMRLLTPGDGTEVAAQAATLAALPVDPDAVPAPGARRAVRFETVHFDLVAPAREGGWDVALEAVEVSTIGWTRELARRTLGLATVAAERRPADDDDWRVVYELDPGSPRLHERLRRLPGMGLPHVPVPHVPLPSLARPTLPRLPQLPLKNVPLPTLPMPQVSMPQVPSLTAIVPRFSGLLAAGHSRVEPHPLGPMLQLPAAEAADAPAWEGIVVAGAEPETPHVVEIEFPPDQDAAVAVAVLELDASGSRVESRHSGGFEVCRADAIEPVAVGRHRFVFWPATRHPVVLLANRSTTAPALVGHVRILAGPRRLPAATEPRGRAVHAFLPDPALGDFGPHGHWAARVTAVSRTAELLAAQGSAGALLTVHAAGAAVWPSRCLREAPRWTADHAGGGDLLAAACRVYEREGLRLVAGLSFDTPLPALEAQLARGGAAAAGIACVGRDGRPRRVGAAATTHYNVLDPRVQQAVEDLVRELAGRLRGSAAVDGVALIMPHDGWLHLPGVAWGLDDATFARFRAAAGVEPPAANEDTCAARAALVEGTLRDRWLDWRAAELARFHARLADVLAAHDPRWSLFVVPSTLCVAGPVAERLRPTLGPAPAAEQVLREIGLDPVRSTAHRRVVFVAPHVHGGEGRVVRGTIAAGNAAAARGATAAARRAGLVLEQVAPLDVGAVVPHGPFGSASPPEFCGTPALATGPAAGRPFAELLVASDMEAVFDSRLALEWPAERPADRSAFAALPAVALGPVAGMPVPLVVRTWRGDDATWVHVVNPAGAPVRASLAVSGERATAVDAISGALIDSRASAIAVDLPAWGMRVLRLEATAAVTGARLVYAPATAADVEQRVAGLVRRCAALDLASPLDVLDNPAFDIGGEVAGPGRAAAQVAGWEIVEPRRGGIALVAGADGGRAAAFSSSNGLATLRSNPFAPPASCRVSVAARLRVRAGDPQPPLRVAIEGVRDDREYYRFAAVGGLTGGRPLTADWQQFVLQVDDLPDAGLESLRVRFDLLGPGAVEIDDVRVFDLAFAEPERVRLSRQIGGLSAAVEAGDVGVCVAALDGYWPRFLEAHVPLPAAPEPAGNAAAAPATPPPAARTGVLDRMWRMWQ